MRNTGIVLMLFLFVGLSAKGQNELLAKNYFEQGEYEKAISIYEKLYEKEPGRLDFLKALVESNQQLEYFAAAEKLLIDRLNTKRVIPQLYVDLGYNFALQNKNIEAEQNYNLALEAIVTFPNYVYSVGKAFENYSLLDYAIVIYEKAMAENPDYDFNMQLARIYGEQGKLEEMFTKYIDLIEKNPSEKNRAQNDFSLYISEDSTNEANTLLRKILLQKLQKEPNILFNELLSWLFIQQKEYQKAFIQEKAIYKRTEEDLRGIANLALVTIAEDDYENAVPIVNFLIENSPTPEAKLQGYQYLMKIAIKTSLPSKYEEVEGKFQDLFNVYGLGSNTYLLQIDYNHFLAFKMKKLDLATTNLKTLANVNLSPYQKARVKMELADILVYDEKFNEALIYYSQIQNKVQNDVLAQEARFKVAQTSYFKGDFEWAQVQLDVLSKSASQLIANDAMQLALLIRDNSIEDSTQTALRKYAKADLKAFQSKNIEAILALEEIVLNHKGEKIEDEALLKLGKLYEETQEYEKAEINYLKLIEFYKEDILADDAYFRLARLYENQLQQPEKAKELYEQIIFNFADSIYFVEARKRFRSLRGDAIN